MLGSTLVTVPTTDSRKANESASLEHGRPRQATDQRTRSLPVGRSPWRWPVPLRDGSAAGGDAEADPSDAFSDGKGNWRTDAAMCNVLPEASLERQEFWDVFRACLDGLPQRQAEAFALREVDGLASQEICQGWGISASNLWVLLHRARLRLTRCMQSHCDQEIPGRVLTIFSSGAAGDGRAVSRPRCVVMLGLEPNRWPGAGWGMRSLPTRSGHDRRAWCTGTIGRPGCSGRPSCVHRRSAVRTSSRPRASSALCGSGATASGHPARHRSWLSSRIPGTAHPAGWTSWLATQVGAGSSLGKRRPTQPGCCSIRALPRRSGCECADRGGLCNAAIRPRSSGRSAPC
ncbi:MAG: hypothetical protein EA424_07175 [Planctomycetaceae bacterium]|nr:MAG: hypothetical protein EA424_07175 [Planctomycetaceae bacterium]